MSRGTWSVQIKSGGSWISDGNLYRPNDSLNIPKMSTQTSQALADGNTAYVTPSIKYQDQPISFSWYFDDGSTKVKIQGYIDSQNDVKIIDQNDTEYVGRFLNMNSTWLVGFDTDKYDIKATFIIMPTIA